MHIQMGYQMNIFSEVAITGDGLGFYTYQSVYRVIPQRAPVVLTIFDDFCKRKLVHFM